MIFKPPTLRYKTLHFRNEMRFSSNERPARCLCCVLIGRVGELRGEIGKICCLQLVFLGDIWASCPWKARQTVGLLLLFPDIPDLPRKDPILDCKWRCQHSTNYTFHRKNMAIWLIFTGNINIISFEG